MKDLKDILLEASLSSNKLDESSILTDIEDNLESGDNIIQKIYYIPQLKDFKKCKMYEKHETWYVDWNIDWWIKEYNMNMSKYERAFRFHVSEKTNYILRFVLTLEEKHLLTKKWSLSIHLIKKNHENRKPENEDRLYGWHGWETNESSNSYKPYLVKGNINNYKQQVIDLINDLADTKNKNKFISIFEYTSKLANQGLYTRVYKGTFSEPNDLIKNLFEL